jgi:myo-inositol-1(or 4)-monophosphatase
MDLQQARAAAEQAALAAGDVVMRYYGTDVPQTTKSNIRDIVTEADKAAETVILPLLRAALPEAAMFSEESAADERPGAPQWHVDPIDGTTNFAASMPFFSISIGLSDAAGRPLVGVVYCPVFRELFSAAAGHGAALNGRPLHVSRTTVLERALLCSGFSVGRETGEIANLAAWKAMMFAARDIRRMGSAALELAYVAAGRLDGYWESSLHTWDIMAGLCLVEQAGGRISDYSGGHERLRDAREIAASNGHIHDAMLAALPRLG